MDLSDGGRQAVLKVNTLNVIVSCQVCGFCVKVAVK